MPERQGLAIYFAVLSEYPETLLRMAAREVAKPHKWPRLPYPADFIAVIKDQAESSHWLLQNIRKTHEMLQKRSEIR